MYSVTPARIPESRAVVSSIMDRIYREEPGHWPYGLSIAHLDGGAYLVRESRSSKPVGFVGWQKRADAGQTVAYYAIGILPEYRCRGLGKEAVAKLVDQIRPEVDEVRGFIVDGNRPSLALADSLGIRHMNKCAGWGTARALAGAGIGAGFGLNSYGRDMADNPGRSIAGIAGNTLAGAYMGKLPLNMRMAPQYAAALGGVVLGNSGLGINRLLEQAAPTLEAVEGTSKVYQESLDTIKKINEDEDVQNLHRMAAANLPWAVPLGLAGLVAIPAAMAYSSRQRAKQLSTLAGLSLDLPETRAAQKIEEIRDMVQD
ncbi:MAG: GNAT family N-acetyltransferase, partial [Dehalococcoidia bacterium]|nr:GNAT family N-acetyltransferase [Dehalococcoidia bacterium]